ncbi:hypothetical protein KQ306_01180 [Synechococcus sp. CS-1324]|uniref:glycosyltransferase family 90 protein n=1 Tax=Synechococcus sp. CS-1324 TaxID=2847980 RepID=UPI00223BD541|nr:glycosyltransferase family 90 protein [Synechococcus sp. CS-1324]MCT0229477.1 hypothetical protein [Synechococcus sp. CS-1324]
MPLLKSLSSSIDNEFSIRLDAGDLGVSSGDCLCMDSSDLANVVPDLYAMITYRSKPKALPQLLDAHSFFRSFDAKLPSMLWRGSTTGGVIGQAGLHIGSLNDLWNNPRFQICKKLRGSHSAIDLALSRLVQIDEGLREAAKTELVNESIFSSEISESEIMAHRFYPDIPGNARAWGSLSKYLAGCLVFKPPSKRYLAYDPLLQPWRHFIPTAKDFSDLPEQVNWALKNHEEACWIAYRGFIAMHAYVHLIPDLMKAKALAYANFSGYD